MDHHESRREPGQPLIRALSIGLAAILLTSCATMKPGTGDIAFRLRWEGSADLDLHVEDPDGGHVSFFTIHTDVLAEGEPQSEGILDIDCNSAPDRLCKKPIENIFWPVGRAPAGTYTVWTHLFQALHDDSEVPFTIEILRGETVVEQLEGKLSDEHRTSQHFTYAYGRDFQQKPDPAPDSHPLDRARGRSLPRRLSSPRRSGTPEPLHRRGCNPA